MVSGSFPICSTSDFLTFSVKVPIMAHPLFSDKFFCLFIVLVFLNSQDIIFPCTEEGNLILAYYIFNQFAVAEKLFLYASLQNAVWAQTVQRVSIFLSFTLLHFFLCRLLKDGRLFFCIRDRHIPPVSTGFIIRVQGKCNDCIIWGKDEEEARDWGLCLLLWNTYLFKNIKIYQWYKY